MRKRIEMVKKGIPRGTSGERGLHSEPDTTSSDRESVKAVSVSQENLLSEFYTLPAKKALDRILEHASPQEAVQTLSHGDFFWLVKKVGEDDCLPLLELASADQWQYLLDHEIWRKDRLNVASISLWMKRLLQVDPRRLVTWLMSEGQALAYHYFLRTVEVVVTSEDESQDLPDDLIPVDGGLHIKVINPEYRDIIEEIIRSMASHDLAQCQNILFGSEYILPAELEEEMYRLRGVRLAEHGFFPFEEALSVYAPLDLKFLGKEKPPQLPDILLDQKAGSMVPLSPLYHTEAQNMFMLAISRTKDPLFLDRLRLEFAGLCNQILSADGLLIDNVEVLIRSCRKAAGYINVALESVCTGSTSQAEELLRNHPLVSLFRVGSGLALELKREAEQWAKASWFRRQGFGTGFWGERWGGILAGLLQRRPRFFTEPVEGEEYKDFERLSELEDCRKVLHQLIALDTLLEGLAEFYQVDNRIAHPSEPTFYMLLFTLWSRLLLKLEPCFSAISLEQAKHFFRKLRVGEKRPPFQMPGLEETFITELMGYAASLDVKSRSTLRHVLSLIWQEFRQEHERIFTDDLDRRYSKFIVITPRPAASSKSM